MSKYTIISHDKKQEFSVPKWQYYHHEEIHVINPWSYTQGPVQGLGRQKSFESRSGDPRGEYTHRRTYDAVIDICYRRNIPEPKFAYYDKSNQTYCNKSAGAAFEIFGRSDIANEISAEYPDKMINQQILGYPGDLKALDANMLIEYLRATCKQLKTPRRFRNPNKMIIVGHYKPNGIGHVSVGVDWGTDGHYYCDNIGDFRLSGVRHVDGTWGAFWTDFKNLEFFEVTR